MVSAVGVPPDLIERLRSPRHPVIGPPVFVPTTSADPPGVVHASVSHPDQPERSAGGGVARDRRRAALAACGESIERMAAVYADLPTRPVGTLYGGGTTVIGVEEFSLHSAAQAARPGCPPSIDRGDDTDMVEMTDLVDGSPVWVPAALVTLAETYGPISTSSGLAADPSMARALERALEELVERDALVTTWLHQLGGREVTATRWHDEADAAGTTIRVFDVTPAFSPHPVAVVVGTMPLAGRARHSLGAACRARWDDAAEKAYLECTQGVVFAGHLMHRQPQLARMQPDDVTDFDRHAAYYTARPERFAGLPLLAGARPADAPADAPAADAVAADQLAGLVAALAAAGVRVLGRELTTVDANQLGLRVVRVVCPELTPIHHDHRWPFLGGRTADVTSRYPGADTRRQGPFPSPHPHPLG